MGFIEDGKQESSKGDSQTLEGQTSQNQLPIGVFDSGVGGLTVLQALQERLPHESFLYFGDTANVPYGTRAPEEILALARQLLDWLEQVPVKMAIMACNTSSAWALDQVRTEYNIPILGIILPGARAAAIQGQRIGVMATPATVASDCYLQAVLENNPTAAVTQVSCPDFVPIIEQNLIHEPQTVEVIRRYLQPLLEAQIDTLVYGCTHYPHLAAVLEPLLPAGVKVVNPAEYMAKAAEQELKILQLHNSSQTQTTQFFVSGCPRQFAQWSAQWLGEMPQVQQAEFANALPLSVEMTPPVDA